ncbi:hypothetical protein H0H93_009169 [Arthromyces matolae]|nr:hypothetical protein H0H93_009169 [Arthromyces matolae]
MVLKLYGYPVSTSTQRVAIVLIEKQVPFELVVVDLNKGEHKTPAHLEKQPFGQIPYIDDDGFILYESRAICRYIAIKYATQGTKLLPTGGLKEIAIFEQAASSEESDFDAIVGPAIFENVYKNFLGETPDPKIFKELINKLDGKLEAYDKILSKQKYLTGDEVTLADLYHISNGVMLSQAGSDIIYSKPNVARWFKELTSRPSWEAVKDGIKSTA